MSHPPETSLSSRELAEWIVNSFTNDCTRDEDVLKVIALIDAWVRVREAAVINQCAIEAGERSHEGVSSHTMLGDMWDARIRDLATARKQLGEKA